MSDERFYNDQDPEETREWLEAFASVVEREGAEQFFGEPALNMDDMMQTGDQGYGFFIIHGHAGKCFADIFSSQYRIRIAIRSFRVCPSR